MNNTAFITCPGCGLRLPSKNLSPPQQFHASGECVGLYYELTNWTLSRGDSEFLHQYAVDAYEAQHTGEDTRSIMTIFALIGLYLAVEKGFTGRQVQLAHIKIGKRKRAWPKLMPPEHAGELTVRDVLCTNTDIERRERLLAWAITVWNMWDSQQDYIRKITEQMLFKR